MSNTYIILCLLALIACNVSMLTNSSEEENHSDDQTKFIFLRQPNDRIDGRKHYIKSAGITYRQRMKNNRCLVEYNHQLLAETNVIKVRKKLFRVDNCLLERVYHACGPNLILMMSVVCRLIQRQTATDALNKIRREIPMSTDDDDDLGVITYKTKRVITESCCENLCSVSELTRYCHR